LKILILTSSFPRWKGDFQGNFIFHQALGQVKRGHEVHVICPHLPGLALNEDMEGIVVHRFRYFFPERLERLNTDTGMFSALSSSILAWLEIPFFMLCEWYASDRLVRQNHVDVIHSHWIIPQGIAGYVCTKIRHIPHVVSSHVVDAQVFSRGILPPTLLRLLLSGADFLTTNSNYTKKVIAHISPIPCPSKVIPMGVSLPVTITNSTIPSEKPRILFIGRLIEWKGVEILIRAMAVVIRKKPQAILSIVGDGPERYKLEYLAKDLGISQNVQFLGRVSDSALEELYSEASVFVLPSREHMGMVMEGLGMVLLEAMARGVPVIGSATGGITDIIKDGENGFLVPPENTEILAEKILLLTSDEALIRHFRERGRKSVETGFSWDEVSKQFSEVYTKVLESGGKVKS